jgi:hypothetical protein
LKEVWGWDNVKGLWTLGGVENQIFTLLKKRQGKKLRFVDINLSRVFLELTKPLGRVDHDLYDFAYSRAGKHLEKNP